jgi:hypothetical protein
MTPEEAFSHAMACITAALYGETVDVSTWDREDAIQVVSHVASITAAVIRAFAAEFGEDPLEVWVRMAPTITPAPNPN